MRIGFTPRQVTRLTGVPYSTLNLWANNGLVRPSVAEGAGSGSERVYSFSDLIALKVALELRSAGISTRSLRRVINFLKEQEGLTSPLSEARLIVSGSDVVIVKNRHELLSVLNEPGQACLSFVVDLPRTLGSLVDLEKQRNVFAVGVSSTEVTPTSPKAVHSSRLERAHKKAK